MTEQSVFFYFIFVRFTHYKPEKYNEKDKNIPTYLQSA